MATRRRKRRKSNPHSLSPRLYNRITQVVENIGKTGDEALGLSTFANGRIASLLRGYANSAEKFWEHLEDELDEANAD